MIGIINYGAGNTRSVQNALERIGVDYILSDRQSELSACGKIIFPGVGSAAAAMQTLKEKELVNWIKQCQKPFLGICLGMQLLFESSDEGNVECLRIIPGRVQKFQPTKKIPHMGWNQCDGVYYYFVHSYLAPINEFTVAAAQYQDETFAAIVCRSNFWGCQFHPEKSGKDGEQLLLKFIAS